MISWLTAPLYIIWHRNKLNSTLHDSWWPCHLHPSNTLEFKTHFVILIPDAERFAHSEVADLSVLFVGQENVPCGQITMNKVLALEVCHPVRHLMHQHRDVLHRHATQQKITQLNKNATTQGSLKEVNSKGSARQVWRRNSIAAEKVCQIQCLFPNPSWLVRKDVPPTSHSNISIYRQLWLNRIFTKWKGSIPKVWLYTLCSWEAAVHTRDYSC